MPANLQEMARQKNATWTSGEGGGKHVQKHKKGKIFISVKEHPHKAHRWVQGQSVHQEVLQLC